MNEQLESKSEVELLPCPNPWCNSHRTRDAEIAAMEAPILVEDGGLYHVACPVCPVDGPSNESPAWARTFWNTRALPRDPQGLVEALRRLLNALDSCVDLTPEVIASARTALAAWEAGK